MLRARATSYASALDYGLSGALYTHGVELGMLLAREVETGLIHVNDQRVNDELFSGERESGIGRFGGEWVMDEMPRA